MTRTAGTAGELAIRDYQQLAGLMSEIPVTQRGAYELEITVLDGRLDKFDAIYNEVSAAADITALWEKYPPGGEDASAAPQPAHEAADKPAPPAGQQP